MAERINLGDGRETTDSDGEPVTRHKYFYEISSSLANLLTSLSMERGESPNEVFAQIVSDDGDIDITDHEEYQQVSESDEDDSDDSDD